MIWLAHEVSSPIYGRETSINHWGIWENMDQPVTHHNSTAVSGWAAASVALAVLCGVHAEVVLEALQRDAAQLLGSMSRVGRSEMTRIDVDDNF